MSNYFIMALELISVTFIYCTKKLSESETDLFLPVEKIGKLFN